jgi:hypothetical protein
MQSGKRESKDQLMEVAGRDLKTTVYQLIIVFTLKSLICRVSLMIDAHLTYTTTNYKVRT